MDFEQNAEDLRTALRGASLTSPDVMRTLLVALRQELQERLQEAESGPLMAHVLQEMQVRREGEQQVGLLPLIQSGRHPFRMAQGLVAGLELVVAEDLRTLAP